MSPPSLSLSVAGFRIRRPCDGIAEVVAGRTLTATARATLPVAFTLTRSGTVVARATVEPRNGVATWLPRFPHTGRHVLAAAVSAGEPPVVTTRHQVIDSILPRWSRIGGVRLSVAYARQDVRLSCEAATLRMAHNYFRPGRIRTDAQIHALTGIDRRRPAVRGGCDPDLAFCGDPAGYMFGTGYGVHDAPIASAATKLSPCRPGLRLRGITGAGIARYIDQGYPVVVWGAHPGPRSPVMPVRWVAWTGRTITAWNVEHTWLVIGFTGSAAAPSRFIVHDPKVGPRTVSAAQFASFVRPFRTAVVVRG